MNHNLRNQPAFPAQAAQDNLGKIFTPFPGITLYQHVLLQFAITGAAQNLEVPDSMTDDLFADSIMKGAKCLTEAYFRAIEVRETDAKIVNL